MATTNEWSLEDWKQTCRPLLPKNVKTCRKEIACLLFPTLFPKQEEKEKEPKLPSHPQFGNLHEWWNRLLLYQEPNETTEQELLREQMFVWCCQESQHLFAQVAEWEAQEVGAAWKDVPLPTEPTVHHVHAKRIQLVLECISLAQYARWMFVVVLASELARSHISVSQQPISPFCKLVPYTPLFPEAPGWIRLPLLWRGHTLRLQNKIDDSLELLTGRIPGNDPAHVLPLLYTRLKEASQKCRFRVWIQLDAHNRKTKRPMAHLVSARIPWNMLEQAVDRIPPPVFTLYRWWYLFDADIWYNVSTILWTLTLAGFAICDSALQSVLVAFSLLVAPNTCSKEWKCWLSILHSYWYHTLVRFSPHACLLPKTPLWSQALEALRVLNKGSPPTSLWYTLVSQQSSLCSFW